MFDTPSELLERINLGEDSLLELKAVTVGAKGLLAPHPESLAQEIAALNLDTLPFRQFTRNETLVGLLGRLRFEIDAHDAPIRRGRFMEARGEGVPIIFRETRNLGAPEPVYALFNEQELRLTLFAQP